VQQEAVLLAMVSEGTFTLDQLETSVSLDDVYRVLALKCYQNYDHEKEKDQPEEIDLGKMWGDSGSS